LKTGICNLIAEGEKGRGIAPFTLCSPGLSIPVFEKFNMDIQDGQDGQDGQDKEMKKHHNLGDFFM
jgi:hypothetical protein